MITISIRLNLKINESELIGKGTQGKVYRIDSKRCVKIFKNKKDCMDELTTLIMGQNDKHIPRLYGYGPNYIIREYIDGRELNEYLSEKKLTWEISRKIIELYESMVKIGYKRRDSTIFHILITPSKELKLIDTAKAMKKKSHIPNLLISGLEQIGCKEDFFNYLKIHRPDIFSQWINYKRKKYRKKH